MNILLVCTGNICRSPMAEGLLRQLLQEKHLSDQITVDSAGTHALTNQPPDSNAQAVMAVHGIDISQLRSRPLVRQDLEHNDRILLADSFNREYIMSIFKPSNTDVIDMLMHFHPDQPITDIPDPYGSAENLFSEVYNLISAACTALADELQESSGRGR